MGSAKHYDLTTGLDRSIPFMPGWSFIYLGCFLFWAVNYILITRQSREEWFQFATGDYLSRLICGIFFVLLPTTNIRPEIVGDGVVQGLIRFIYRIDAPTNLFPSIHCLVSWMCFIGIRGKSYIPKWYRIFSCLFAIAVFASTLFTKQHFVVDVVAGVIFAEICYYIGRHTKFYRKVGRIFDNVNRKAFGDYMKNKKNLFNILFLLLVFGLTMHYVFHGEDLNALGSYLSQADIRYWLAGVVLVVIFILSESVIIYYMMRSVGQNVILTHCFLYSFVGFFL